MYKGRMFVYTCAYSCILGQNFQGKKFMWEYYMHTVRNCTFSDAAHLLRSIYKQLHTQTDGNQ